MPPAATVAGAPSASPSGGAGAMVPFLLASNIYVEKFNNVTIITTATDVVYTFDMVIKVDILYLYPVFID